MNPRRDLRISHALVTIGVAVGVSAIGAIQPAAAARPAPAFRNPGNARVAPTPSPRSTSLNTYQVDNLRTLSLRASAEPIDTLRMIVFQVQFTDSLMGGQTGSKRRQVRDSTFFANELAHLEQYFSGASRSRLTLRWTLDGELYTLAHRQVYYGADANEEDRVVELVEEVIALADDKIDFSQYDHVFVIHADPGQETDLAADSPYQIWSSFYDLSDIRTALDDDEAVGLATEDVAGTDPFFSTIFPSSRLTRRRTERSSERWACGRSRLATVSACCRSSIRRRRGPRIPRARAPSA